MVLVPAIIAWIAWITIGAVALLLLALILSVVTARIAGVTPHPKDALEGTRSIGDLIEAARGGGPAVHIIFVHGIRAQKPGGSDVFQAEMCKLVKLTEAPRPPRHWIDLGPPPPATFAGKPVWDEITWPQSRPFVDRRLYADGKARVVVDEVNWWPLVFPLKGRYLVFPEIDLAGPDRENLALLMKGQSDPPPNTYFPWLKKADVEGAIRHRPRKSGGAPINAALKLQLLNWGLSDAVIALGPMRTIYRIMMDRVFEHADEDAPAAPSDKIFVIVSESLGSFIVLDALSAPAGQAETAKQALLNRTFDLYFFANQFRLLALGRLWDPCADEASEPPPPPPDVGFTASRVEAAHRRASPLNALEIWAQAPAEQAPPQTRIALQTATKSTEITRQIIAFNDPSDALTYEVPDVDGAKVANVYDRNGPAWLWLLESPITAHTGHSKNHAVMKTLFRR